VLHLPESHPPPPSSFPSAKERDRRGKVKNKRTGVPSQRIGFVASPITSVALSIIRSTAKLGGPAVRFEIGRQGLSNGRLFRRDMKWISLTLSTHSFDVRESWRWRRTLVMTVSPVTFGLTCPNCSDITHYCGWPHIRGVRDVKEQD